MTVFAEALDDLFADPSLGVDAVWRTGGVDPGFPVRIFVRLADRVTDYGPTRIASGTAMVEVRISDVATPSEGDTVSFGGRTLVVQGEPLADALRLVWTIECRPA